MTVVRRASIAGSIWSGRFVAPTTNTPRWPADAVDLGEQLVDLRVVDLDGTASPAIASISSMKTIDGRFARARSKSRRMLPLRLPDPLAHDVRAGHGIERAARLRRQHLRDRRLAGARRAGQQQTGRRVDAEAPSRLGILDDRLQLLELRLDGGRQDERVPRPVLDRRTVLCRRDASTARIRCSVPSSSCRPVCGGLAEHLQRRRVDDLLDRRGRHALGAADQLVEVDVRRARDDRRARPRRWHGAPARRAGRCGCDGRSAPVGTTAGSRCSTEFVAAMTRS